MVFDQLGLTDAVGPKMVIQNVQQAMYPSHFHTVISCFLQYDLQGIKDEVVVGKRRFTPIMTLAI